jgi:two-component system cell cycle sensor histidine kinase/response regulator CckA
MDIIDLNRVVADVSRMLRRLIGENIDLRVDCSAASATTRTDVSHVEQVLINLVVNARDAMPGGGCISVATRCFAADAGFAAAHPGVTPGKYVALEVADNGHGMNEDVLAHLFDPFFTTKSPGRGTGLGLSVVSSIVAQSDGHILVESTPGHGSRFTVLLPLAEGAVDALCRTPVERRRFDGRAKILIAEDEEQVRSLAAVWLRRYGYTVFEAADGEEALALVASGGVRPDLLITDVVMPNLGGAPLAESLRGVFLPLKVLYMSGYANRPEIQGRLQEDGVAFLQKPFSPGRLLSEVRSLLTWSAAERRTLASLGKLPPPPARKATTSVAPLAPRFRTV